MVTLEFMVLVVMVVNTVFVFQVWRMERDERKVKSEMVIPAGKAVEVPEPTREEDTQVTLNMSDLEKAMKIINGGGGK